MRALLVLLLVAGCTERVSLDPGHGSGGAPGSGGHGGAGEGGWNGGSGGIPFGFPCPPGDPCSREGAVCSDACVPGPTGATQGHCMCVRGDFDTMVWACTRVWCDAGFEQRCPPEQSPCQPDWVLADCCANGQIRYCLCPGDGPGAFNWQCRTLNAACN